SLCSQSGYGRSIPRDLIKNFFSNKFEPEINSSIKHTPLYEKIRHDMMPTISSHRFSDKSSDRFSDKRTGPPVEPPALHLFSIEPGAKKHCFNRSITEESLRENFMPHDVPDLQIIRDVRSITSVNSAGHHHKLRPRIRASSEGVVHGTGVVSKQRFKKNDFIALYHGPLIYRVRSRQHKRQQKFNVFRLDPDKGTPVPRFLEKDTFAAWSNVFLKHSGFPSIEIGRDAVGPIRYLNHSKNANVKITSRIVGRLPFNECEKLLLRVIALKDIAPGEELLFDYDPGLPESEIDFTLSTVEKPLHKKAQAIRRAIRNIYQKTLEG
ncbi:SET domain-containing protein, partial [Endozoicomonas sp. SESOKO1]|uniref:SET domain-containing protein n=1 Tax=Endozoicomonas sp. SESOKO1 TaxID=2828742 RepID=UPI002149403A